MRRILIAKPGTDLKRQCYSLPWKYDSTCYNFREPDELISDTGAITIPDPMDVGTLVIFSNLKDYSFVMGMKNLEQLYIYKAKHINDVSFLEKLVKLRQLCIANSKITNLNGLERLMRRKRELYDSSKKNMMANITYGMEGIFLNSEKQGLENVVFDNHGVSIAEFTTTINSKKNEYCYSKRDTYYWSRRDA